ncbi:MAG: hypothetical protein ACK41R_09330, partial [Thermus sp.]
EEPALLRQRVAALAQEVDRLAAEDLEARRLLEAAAGELGLLAHALARRLGVFRVAPLGGVFRSPHVLREFRRRTEALGLQVVPPKGEPAEMAARLARERAKEMQREG